VTFPLRAAGLRSAFGSDARRVRVVRANSIATRERETRPPSEVRWSFFPGSGCRFLDRAPVTLIAGLRSRTVDPLRSLIPWAYGSRRRASASVAQARGVNRGPAPAWVAATSEYLQYLLTKDESRRQQLSAALLEEQRRRVQ